MGIGGIRATRGKTVGPRGREPVLAGSGPGGCNADPGWVGEMTGGCKRTTSRAPIRALYDLEFKEPAFEGTIKERGSARGGQADQLRQGQVGSEKISPAARE